MESDPAPAFACPSAARRPRAALVLVALALLGFAATAFADHLASYYLLQWAPTLRRFPTHEERLAVLQALALDRATHGAMWLTLAGSLLAWLAARRRQEAAAEAGRVAAWLASGIAGYAVLRVVVEAQLDIGLVRVPNVAVGIDWHGPGFALAGLALLLAVHLVTLTSRRALAVPPRR